MPPAGPLILLVLLAASCGARPTLPAAWPASDAVVAEVGGVPIHRSEVQSEMRRTGKDARHATQELVDFELLAVAAAPSTDADPDVRQSGRQAMVQAMLEHELEPRLGKAAIPDAELAAIYDKARSAFVHPRLVEIGILTVYTGGRMKAEPRARALDDARALDAYLRQHPAATLEEFKAIADQPSWRERRVKYARLWQALDEPFPAEVGRAAAALTHPGDATSLVTSETGYHIARYIAERPPETVTFQQAQPSLRDQIYPRWRQARFIEYAQQLANPHQIEAFPEKFESP